MSAADVTQPGSSSLRHPDYWWHRARAGLLQQVFSPYVDAPTRVLDVGSADAPSVGWLRGEHQHVNLDLIPEGLVPGEGVCGSVTALPFADAAFDVVGAFDVVEHCQDDHLALTELARVTRSGGHVLLSVPAYSWAWTDHDVRAGHHRRYTRPQLRRAVEDAGLEVRRATYAFASVFPIFAAERGARRLRRGSSTGGEQRLPAVSSRQDKVLMGLSRLDERALRRVDLPFGSSVFVAARKR